MEELMVPFLRALESLDRPRIEAIFQDALGRQSPMSVLDRLIAPSLEQLGDEWEAGRISLSQIYISSRICEEMVERVLPPMALYRKSQPRHAIVVLNDYHVLGKRIVLAVMRASGFEIMDYKHMIVNELVERVINDNLEILLVSVLMLPSALKVKEVRLALENRGKKLRIAVGGAPFLFDSQLWREVGADAMGRSATEAVSIVQRWMEEMT